MLGKNRERDEEMQGDKEREGAKEGQREGWRERRLGREGEGRRKVNIEMWGRCHVKGSLVLLTLEARPDGSCPGSSRLRA
jgi:hypothetical protein